MRFITNMVNGIKYNSQHRRAILKVEKQIYGYNTFLTHLHDIDKLIMICLFVPRKTIHDIHRFYSWHHVENKIGWLRLDEVIFDWASARMTKSDKPDNVITTARKYYPHMVERIEKRLNDFGTLDL